ncbi:hypothetical protein GE09DRAFT_1268922, partial [Coniochaeta sp. 2T2.1]
QLSVEATDQTSNVVPADHQLESPAPPVTKSEPLSTTAQTDAGGPTHATSQAVETQPPAERTIPITTDYMPNDGQQQDKRRQHLQQPESTETSGIQPATEATAVFPDYFPPDDDDQVASYSDLVHDALLETGNWPYDCMPLAAETDHWHQPGFHQFPAFSPKEPSGLQPGLHHAYLLGPSEVWHSTGLEADYGGKVGASVSELSLDLIG